ncbi:hypothetical protein HII31_06089 [Pseudocercospora fuligena]|uniref:Uncharacterized protein n=1 Tax=Pseudocercospora fuligena TaxID=685502 RepID=A0A8H6VI93_9PEZI|nr:hypothetical protein HII31_06089 [Pseudocercospora fuligena]
MSDMQPSPPSPKEEEEMDSDMKEGGSGKKVATGQQQTQQEKEEQGRMLYEERAHRDAENRWDAFSLKQLHAPMQCIFAVIHASLTRPGATVASVVLEVDEVTNNLQVSSFLEAIAQDTEATSDAVPPTSTSLKKIFTRIHSKAVPVAELRNDMDAILTSRDASVDIRRHSSDIASFVISIGLRIAKHQLAPIEQAIQKLHSNMKKYHNISPRSPKLSDIELDIEDLHEYSNSLACRFWKRVGELLAVFRDPIKYTDLAEANGFLYATLAKQPLDNEGVQSVRCNADHDQQEINTLYAAEVALSAIGHFTSLPDMEAYGDPSAEQCRKTLVFFTRKLEKSTCEKVDSAASHHYHARNPCSVGNQVTKWIWQLEQSLKRIVAWIVRHTGGTEWWLLSSPISRRRVFLYFIYESPLMACMQAYDVFDRCVGFRPIWGVGKDVPMAQYWRDFCVDMMLQDCETTWLYEILPLSLDPDRKQPNKDPPLSLNSGLRAVASSRYFQTRYDVRGGITWKDVPISIPKNIPKNLARITTQTQIYQSLLQLPEPHPFDRHSPLYAQASSGLQCEAEEHPDIIRCGESSEAIGEKIRAIREQHNVGQLGQAIGMEKGYRGKVGARHGSNTASPGMKEMLWPSSPVPGLREF